MTGCGAGPLRTSTIGVPVYKGVGRSFMYHILRLETDWPSAQVKKTKKTAATFAQTSQYQKEPDSTFHISQTF